MGYQIYYNNLHSCHGQNNGLFFGHSVIFGIVVSESCIVSESENDRLFIARLVQIPSNWQSTPAISTIHKQFPTPILVYRCQVTLGYQRVVTCGDNKILWDSLSPFLFTLMCLYHLYLSYISQDMSQHNCPLAKPWRRVCDGSAGGLGRLTYSPLFLWLAVPNKISVSFGTLW